MNRPDEGMRPCPTRVDGEFALIAHRIATSTCQDRQRGMYHKCPTCAHYNARLTTPKLKRVEPPTKLKVG